MPNETIVKYILAVETGKANKNLKSTSQASNQTEQAFDGVSRSTKTMNQKLRGTEKQSKKTSSGFRNMRKAGRDLDGAFSDLGQGIGLINPAAGQLFMTLSGGASIAEGLGRSLLLFVNPAILGVATVTLAAAGALYFWNKSQVAAKKETERINKVITDNTKILEDQERALDTASAKMSVYTDTLIDARMDLDLLTGAMTSLEGATARAKTTARAFEDRSLADQQKVIDSLKTSVAAQKEIEKVKFNAARELEDSKGTSRDVGGKKRKAAIAEWEIQKSITKEIEAQLDGAQSRVGQIINEGKNLEDILTTHAEITQQKKEQTEQDRKNAKFRAQNARAEKERQSAAQKLQGIINKLTIGELTGREKILEQYEQELAVIEQLEITSKDMFAAAEAELLLREKRDRLLDEELRKEKERVVTAQDMLSIVAATASAMRSPESFVSSIGGILGQVGAVPTPAAQAISAGGSAAVAVAGLGGLIQQAIDEAAKQEIPVILDEKQAKKVVLGNMNEAFSNFIRDLERGLELLPETIVRILPAFIVSIGKILTFDIHKMIAIDLPLALLRAIPELVIAYWNEAAFLWAGLINGFRLALDQFTAFIQAAFTKEGRRDAIADSIDGLKRWFETRFTGVEAVRDAIGAFAGGGSFIPQAAGGMRYTGNQRSGLAMLHQGEFVVPQSGMRPQSVDRQMSNSGGSPINIVINSPVVEQNAVDALVRRIEERFNSNFGLSSSNLFGGR